MHNHFSNDMQVELFDHNGEVARSLDPTGEIRSFHLEEIPQHDIRTPYYIRPRPPRFPTFDAAVLTEERAYFLQCIIPVREKHILKTGGIKKLQRALPRAYWPDQKTWCFVWAVDTAANGRSYTHHDRVTRLKMALPSIKDVFYIVCTPPRGGQSAQKFISNMGSLDTSVELQLTNLDSFLHLRRKNFVVLRLVMMRPIEKATLMMKQNGKFDPNQF